TARGRVEALLRLVSVEPRQAAGNGYRGGDIRVKHLDGKVRAHSGLLRPWSQFRIRSSSIGREFTSSGTFMAGRICSTAWSTTFLATSTRVQPATVWRSRWAATLLEGRIRAGG